MSLFQLSCESTVDLPYAYIHGRDIPVLFYNYTVDGTQYLTAAKAMSQKSMTVSGFFRSGDIIEYDYVRVLPVDEQRRLLRVLEVMIDER